VKQSRCAAIYAAHLRVKQAFLRENYELKMQWALLLVALLSSKSAQAVEAVNNS